MNNGKMIAVWGSGGSGKTTTAVKLAALLAEKKKEVILVLTDIIAPDLSVLLPFAKDMRSMGHIWALPCNTDTILKSLVTTKSDYIGILGYKNGENVFSHPDYAKENILDIYTKLKTMADYIIVDCVPEFAYNVLTTVALELADSVIRLGEATTKSFSFFDANLPLLTDSRYKVEQHIRVLTKVKSNQAKEAALSHYGGVLVELPFTEELETQILEGELFTLSSSKGMKNITNSLDHIIQAVTETPALESQLQPKINATKQGKEKINLKRKSGSADKSRESDGTSNKILKADKSKHKDEKKKNPFKLLRKEVS